MQFSEKMNRVSQTSGRSNPAKAKAQKTKLGMKRGMHIWWQILKIIREFCKFMSPLLKFQMWNNFLEKYNCSNLKKQVPEQTYS